MGKRSHESDSSERCLDQQQRKQQLRRALDRLPTRAREVLVLNIYHGLTYKEIAAAMHIQVRSVGASLSLAREELRKALSDSSLGSAPQLGSELPELKMPRSIAPQQETGAEQRRRRDYIHRPAGWKLYGMAEFVFSGKTVTHILGPIIRDLQDEHIEALAEYERTQSKIPLWKSRWVLTRGYWSFWAAVFTQTPISLIKWIFKLWKAV